MKAILAISSLIFSSLGFAADDQAEHNKRIAEAASSFDEIMHAKDGGIPEDLLDRAHCVGIVPNLKRVGFIVGAKYGKGVLTCRLPDGRFSALSTIRIEGGNIGLQIGAGETDVVFVVMNRKGEEQLNKDKFTVGGDVSAMAGPVGRSVTAETDAAFRAEIVSYSRSRGIFAGVSLDGATLRPDNDDNRKIYGRDISQTDILHGRVEPTVSAQRLLEELKAYSPHKKVG